MRCAGSRAHAAATRRWLCLLLVCQHKKTHNADEHVLERRVVVEDYSDHTNVAQRADLCANQPMSVVPTAPSSPGRRIDGVQLMVCALVPTARPNTSSRSSHSWPGAYNPLSSTRLLSPLVSNSTAPEAFSCTFMTLCTMGMSPMLKNQPVSQATGARSRSMARSRSFDFHTDLCGP